MDNQDDDEGLNGGLEWPRKGDRLFASGSRTRLNAFLGQTHRRKHAYISDYRRAAEVLFAHVDETERDQDTLLFPLVFVWRHHLEIQLKNIIELGRYVLGEAGGFKLTGTHDVKKLWEEARRIILAYPHSPPPEPEHIEAMNAMTDDLADLDEKSDGFRYPKDSRGNPTLAGAPHLIGLENAHRRFTRAAGLLECIAAELSRVSEYMAEQEAEMHREYGVYQDSEMRAEYEAAMPAEYEAEMRHYSGE